MPPVRFRRDGYSIAARELEVNIDPEKGLLHFKGKSVPKYYYKYPIQQVIVVKLTLIGLAHGPRTITQDVLNKYDKYAWLQDVVADAHRQTVPAVIDHTEPPFIFTVNHKEEMKPPRKYWEVRLHQPGQRKGEIVAILERQGKSSVSLTTILPS